MKSTLLFMCCQDFFIWGPPCGPYTRLSSKRADPTYNPCRTDEAQPFIKGSLHIRGSNAIRLPWSMVMGHGSLSLQKCSAKCEVKMCKVLKLVFVASTGS